MWNLLMKRLEILGYSRAIGALHSSSQVNKSHIEALIKARDELRTELKKAKALRRRDPHKTYMRGAQSA